jgi:dienelactone hydrolase
MREVCTRRDSGGLPNRERPRDAYGALRWLQSQDFIRPDRIVLMGWSHGGSTVLAAVDASTAARPAGLARDFRGAVAFYPGCRVAEHSRSWTTRIPLTILVGGADDWTPAAPCAALARRVRERGEPVGIIVYPGARHGFDIPGQPLVVRRGLARSARPDRTATVEEDPVSRADAISRVEKLLGEFLKP